MTFKSYLVGHAFPPCREGAAGWGTAILLLAGLSSALVSWADGAVELIRTPSNGIQPQAILDSRGVLHLIYYKGESHKGDVFYARQQPNQKAFSEPLRVNTEPGSAMAAGTIRGAQLAVGKNGRAHVAWNGHPPKKGAWMDAPMLYTRLNEEGTAFERERNLITRARGLDGGGSVAADSQGNVYVFWHAPRPGSTNGEAGRAVFVARSTDEGKTFAPERQAFLEPTGACGCCGMRAFADSQGNLFALYRAATEHVNRDEILLFSRNRGENFEVAYRHGWKIATCPMSSAFLSENNGSILAAAETHGRVFYVRLNAATGMVGPPVSPERKAKHPVAIGNEKGEVLLVWTEGTGWARGGAVAWQVYDKNGDPGPEQGRVEGVPPWGFATAFARPDGRFVIIY